MPHSQYADAINNESYRERSDSSDSDAIEDIADDTLDYFDCETLDCNSPIEPMPQGAPIIVPPPGRSGANGTVPARVERFAERIATFGAWDYEGGDIVPLVLTRLRGWQASGVTLAIVQDGMPTQVFRPDALSATDARGGGTATSSVITVRRFDGNHYVPVVDGREVDQGADGNCLFYSIWYALEATVPEATLRTLYERDPPRDKVTATCYFRAAGAHCLLENHASFSSFVAKGQSATFDEDEWFDASETLDADEPAMFVAGTLESPPFSLTDIAKAGLVLMGSVATQKLIASVISLGTAALPYAIDRLIWNGFRLCQVLNSLARGAYVDAFLDAVLALPFELLSGGSLIAEIADTALAVLKTYAPWLVTALDALNFTVEMNAVNVFALALVATTYHLVVKERIAVRNSSHAQSLISLVQRLQKVSAIYGAIDEQLMIQKRWKPADDMAERTAVQEEKTARHELLNWAKERYGAGYVRKLGLNARTNPMAYIASLRDGSGTTVAVVDEDPAKAMDPLAELSPWQLDKAVKPDSHGAPGPGCHVSSADSGEVARPLQPLATPGNPFAIAGAAFLATSIIPGMRNESESSIVTVSNALTTACLANDFHTQGDWDGEDAVEYFQTSDFPDAVSSGRRTAEMPLLAASAAALAATTSLLPDYAIAVLVLLPIAGFLGWLYYAYGRTESDGGERDRVKFIQNFDSVVSRMEIKKYDPLQWKLIINIQEKETGRTTGRVKRSIKPGLSECSDLLSDNVYDNFIHPVIIEFDKSKFDRLITGFLSVGVYDVSLLTGDEEAASAMLVGWNKIADAMTSRKKILDLFDVQNSTEIMPFMLFEKIVYGSFLEKKVIREELQDISSLEYFCLDLRHALFISQLSDVPLVLEGSFVFEIFKSKIMGGFDVFPYLEVIWGKNPPRFYLEKLADYLQKLETLELNDKIESEKTILECVNTAQKGFEDAVQFGNLNAMDPEGMLRMLGDDDGPFRKKLSALEKALKENRDYLMRQLYVAGECEKAENICQELLKNDLTYYAILRIYNSCESYIEFLIQIFKIPGISLLLDDYVLKSKNYTSYIEVFEARAASVKLHSLVYPEKWLFDKPPLTTGLLLKKRDELMQNHNFGEHDFMIFSDFTFLALLSGRRPEDLGLIATSVFVGIGKMNDVLKDNPFFSWVSDELAVEAFKIFKGFKTNKELNSDIKFFNQFFEFKNKYLDPMAKFISIFSLSQVVTDVYGLVTDVPVQTMVFDFWAMGELPYQHLDNLLDNPSAQKNILYDRPPYTSAYEKFPGELVCFKFLTDHGVHLILVSTLAMDIRAANIDGDSLKLETFQYLAAADSVGLQNLWAGEILLPGVKDVYLPKGTDVALMGRRLTESFEILYKNNGQAVGPKNTTGGYLTYNHEKSMLLSGTRALDVTYISIKDASLFVMSAIKNEKYFRWAWQYFTILLPKVDATYLHSVDPLYTQSDLSRTFDDIDLIAATTTVFSAFARLLHWSMSSILRRLPLKPVFMAGEIGSRAVIVEFKNIVFFSFPDNLLPLTFKSTATGFGKFLKTMELDFSLPIIVVGKGGVPDWIAISDNLMLLMHADGIVAGYFGWLGIPAMSTNDIVNFMDRITSKTQVTLSVPGAYAEYIKNISDAFLSDLEEKSVIKYWLMDQDGNVERQEYVIRFLMKGQGAFCFDSSKAGERGWLMTESEWQKNIKDQSVGKQLRAKKFNSLEDARTAIVSSEEGADLFVVGLLAESGRYFYFNGKKYFKGDGVKTVHLLSSDNYKYSSLVHLLYMPRENRLQLHGIAPDGQIICNAIISVPYIDWATIGGPAGIPDGGVIFSELRLPVGFEYGGWFVKKGYGPEKVLDQIAMQLSNKEPGSSIREGEVFYVNEVRYYKVRRGDGFARIAHHFYGANFLGHKISGWEENIRIFGGNFKLVPRMILAIPYAYLGQKNKFDLSQTDEPQATTDPYSWLDALGVFS